MLQPIQPTPENIAHIANLELPLARTDCAGLGRYRTARDFIWAGGVCLGEGDPTQCLRGCTNEEASLCGRYALLQSALEELPESNQQQTEAARQAQAANMTAQVPQDPSAFFAK